jgi:hypothetical protein
MNLIKRVTGLPTNDLQDLQDAILMEIQRRRDLAPPTDPAVEQPAESAPPAAKPEHTPQRRAA